MEVVRNNQLLEMFEDETGRNFETSLKRGQKRYLEVLGLSNLKDRIAIYSDGKTTSRTSGSWTQVIPALVQSSVHLPQIP